MVKLASGATASIKDPGGSKSLTSPPTCPATPDVADFYDFWKARGDLQSVISWIRAHPPQGAGLGGGGGVISDGRPTSEFVEFSLPPTPGISWSRSLLVNAVPLPGDKTALRVDSQVIWLNPRPASEHVPSGTSAISVVLHYPDGSTSSYEDVSDPSQVGQIVSLTNALPAEQPGIGECAPQGTTAQVIFSAQNGTTLAEADPWGACGWVDFSINNQPQPELSDAYNYINKLESLLGASQN